MRRALFIAAVVTFTPVAAFAMGGGGYSGSMRGYGPGGSSGDKEDYDIAMRLIDKQDYADAIPHLRRVLQSQQGNADVLNYLGYTSRMIGNYSDSLDYYQRALARNPDHKGAHEYLGELYLALHQPDQARSQLAELTRLCPDGCVEKDTLTQAIAKYDAAAGSPPAAPAGAPAAPAAQSPPSSK
jgi:tetratricopeptide (TPR) repeat protein